MAGKGEEQASWSLVLEGNLQDEAAAGAKAMQELGAKMAASQEAVRSLTAAQKGLRGSSEEVKTAKEALKAKIEALKTSMGETSLAMLKGGTSYDKVAASAKKLAAEQAKLAEKSKKSADEMKADKAKALGAAIKTAGGPVADLKEKLATLKEVMGGGNGAAAALTFAAAGLAAAVAAVTAAAIAGAVALGKWIIGAANAERTAQLVRQGFTGTALSAQHLGDQVADLSKRVSLPKEKLNDLAQSLYKTRLSGDAIRDTLNAVAQAADGMGDDVGNAFKDIITRGQMVGRLQINPFELVGKGVDFQDVAESLAKQLGIGVNDAKRALAEGRVGIDAGAKAIRTALEKRFGSTNALKLLDLGKQTERLENNLARMTRDVNLEPLAKGLSDIFSNFDEGTVSGAALKDLITDVGNGISKTFGQGAPKVTHFIKQGIVGALQLEIAYLKLKKAFESAFGKDAAGKIADFAASTVSVRRPLEAVSSVFDQITANLDRLKRASDWAEGLGASAQTAIAKLKNLGWKDVGTAIVTGLVAGLTSSEEALQKAVTGLADKVKKGFKGALGIQSPSKVFAEYGEQTTAGYAQGVDRSAPAAQASVDAMAPGAPARAPAARGGGGIGSMTLHFHLPPGADQSTVRALKEAASSIRNDVMKVVEEALLVQNGGGAGVTA